MVRPKPFWTDQNCFGHIEGQGISKYHISRFAPPICIEEYTFVGVSTILDPSLFQSGLNFENLKCQLLETYEQCCPLLYISIAICLTLQIHKIEASLQYIELTPIYIDST